MNAEEALRAAGGEVTEAYRFVLDAHDRLVRGVENEFEIESELFVRMGKMLQLLRTQRNPPPAFAEFRDYHHRWGEVRRSGAVVVAALSEPHEEPRGPVTMGVAWESLLILHARLAAAPLAHEFVAPYLLFLVGLAHGMKTRAANAAMPDPGERDGLEETARQSLRDAVDFALQEKAQALVQSSSGMPGDTEFQCLFMGVIFAQKNHAPEVHEWLHRAGYQAGLVRMLFVMGVLAGEDRQARRLIIKFSARLPGLVTHSFGEEARRVLDDFAAAASITGPISSFDNRSDHRSER